MYTFFKRLFDILFSLFLLIILSPIFCVVCMILRFSSEGEIFYFQERIGYKNSKFKIIKFATMLKDSMNMGSGSITLRNDFRVTGPGKFLRKTKINELPQLINILKGDISIVGPRPLVEETFNAYSNKLRSQIYDVKPGLTGIGSIIFRDEESIISKAKFSNPKNYYKNEIAPYKGALELWYQKKRSFLLDIQLILLTAWVVFYPNSKIIYDLFNDLPIKGKIID